MVRGGEIHSIIENVFGDVKNIHESEQLQVCCPKCQEREGLFEPDGKYNLEINTDRKLFKCWKCDNPQFSGSLRRLIRQYGTRIDYELYKTYCGHFFDYDVSSDSEVDDIELFLPKEFISFNGNDFLPTDTEHYQAYSYLIFDRKLSWDLIVKYNLGFCLSGRYANRIIIPSYDTYGELNFFIGRSFIDKNNHGNKIIPYLMPKYNKDRIIFNESNINWDSTVYLVEGVFDMFSIPNSIPLLGKNIQYGLFQKIKEMKPNIIILLDPDAIMSAIDDYLLLMTIYGDETHKIRLGKLNGKYDIDEMRRFDLMNDVKEMIYNSTPISSGDYLMRMLTTDSIKYMKQQKYIRK